MKQRQQIDSLTGLRGVAAFWVMLMHFREVTPTRTWQFPLLDSVIANGAYGVDVFFVLSGFIMCYAYANTFQDGLRWSDIRQFLVFRLARIYPVHLATFLAMEALFIVHALIAGGRGLPDRYDSATVLLSLTLMHDWIPHGQTPNMPAWSVSAEWFAYILFPVLAFLLPRKGLPLFGVVAAALALGWFQKLGTYGPAHVLSGFLLGMAAFRFWPSLACVGRLRIAGLVVIGLIGLWANEPEPQMATGLLLFAALVLMLPHPKDVIGRWLATPMAVYLGEISYSLYMVHWPVRVVVRYTLEGIGLLDAIQSPMLVALYVAVTLVAAVASYHCIEIPGRSALRRLAGASTAARIPSAVPGR